MENRQAWYYLNYFKSRPSRQRKNFWRHPVVEIIVAILVAVVSTAIYKNIIAKEDEPTISSDIGREQRPNTTPLGSEIEQYFDQVQFDWP